jgi:hypothetical protein
LRLGWGKEEKKRKEKKKNKRGRGQNGDKKQKLTFSFSQDAALLINLHAGSDDTADVGNYEMVMISAVSGASVNLSVPVKRR